MDRSISIVCFVFICIFSCVIVSIIICPVYAGEPIVDNAKETDKAVSHDARDESVKGNQEQECIHYRGLQYKTTNKDPKPKGAAFIRLKPKLENEGSTGFQKVFDVEFMDEETSGHKAKKDSNNSPYLKFEKIEDPEKDNVLVRKAIEKNYKTEVSMGLRMSPFSEIYLGKGFLVGREDNFNVDPRDDGWRIKLKFDF